MSDRARVRPLDSGEWDWCAWRDFDSPTRPMRIGEGRASSRDKAVAAAKAAIGKFQKLNPAPSGEWEAV